MKNKTAVFVLVIASFLYTATAEAKEPVFSMDPADYGAELNYSSDGKKVSVTIEFRLKKGIKYDDLPLFKDNQNLTGDAFDDWPTTKDQKFIFVSTLFTFPGIALNQMPVQCEKIGDAMGESGEKIRCEQETPVDLGALDSSQFEALAHYMYLIPFNAHKFEIGSGYRIMGAPVNLAALLATGLEEVKIDDQVEEDVVEDDEEGLPAEILSPAAPMSPLADGGACSMIASSAPADLSALLFAMLTLAPLVVRRRR